MNNLSRSLERWANCSPAEMARMSPAAIQYALEDAKHDIAVLARQGWMDEDTAPIDGKEVLTWRKEWRRPFVSYLDRYGVWYDADNHEPCYPTHWQPLPDAPQ